MATPRAYRQPGLRHQGFESQKQRENGASVKRGWKENGRLNTAPPDSQDKDWEWDSVVWKDPGRKRSKIPPHADQVTITPRSCPTLQGEQWPHYWKDCGIKMGWRLL